jgi:hypothetical protein
MFGCKLNRLKSLKITNIIRCVKRAKYLLYKTLISLFNMICTTYQQVQHLKHEMFYPSREPEYAPFFTLISGVCVVYFVKSHVFTFLVHPICFFGSSCFINAICIYLCILVSNRISM